MIDLKIDTSKLRAEMGREIARQDGLSKQVAEQMLIEGKNVAHALSLKDTNFMDDGIERASGVKRLAPCIYEMTLGSDADYTSHQEFGPKSGKRVWRFRPFIRPGSAIMQVKARECIDRVYEG
jgi:hypothetical protein